MNKYQNIAHDIEKDIVKRNLKHGEKLLNLKQLEARYMVSKTTIVSALHLLEERGKIFQVRGSGIFVRKPIRTDCTPLYLNQSIKLETSDEHVFPENHKRLMILHDKTEADLYLDVNNGDEIYFLDKIEDGNKKLKYFEKVYYDVRTSERLGLKLEVGLLSENLIQKVEETISYTDVYIYFETMSDPEATQLNQHHDQSALCIDTVYYSKDGQLFGFSRKIYPRGDNYFLIQTNKRNT